MQSYVYYAILEIAAEYFAVDGKTVIFKGATPGIQTDGILDASDDVAFKLNEMAANISNVIKKEKRSIITSRIGQSDEARPAHNCPAEQRG